MSISKTPASRVRGSLRQRRAKTHRMHLRSAGAVVETPVEATTEEAPTEVEETASQQEVQLLRALLAERDATIALLEGRLCVLERELEQANVDKEGDGIKNNDMNHEGLSVARAEAVEFDDDEYEDENHDMNHEGSFVAPAEAVELDDDDEYGPLPIFAPVRPKGVFPLRPEEDLNNLREYNKENAPNVTSIPKSAATEGDGIKNNDMNHGGSSVARGEAVELDDDEYETFRKKTDAATSHRPPLRGTQEKIRTDFQDMLTDSLSEFEQLERIAIARNANLDSAVKERQTKESTDYFVVLPSGADNVITATLSLSDGAQVHPGVLATVTGRDIKKLNHGVCLNDEVVNHYFQMISQRASEDGRKVHCFNSFMYKELVKNGYQKVRRWTKWICLQWTPSSSQST